MKAEVKVDDLVIIEVLAQFEVKWGDPDFEELFDYSRLRYLHYQHQGVINELTQPAFDRSITYALISDVGEYLIGKFDSSAEQKALALKQMGNHYHFMNGVTPEDQATADQLIHELSNHDQAMIQLLYDGLSQRDIAEATGINRYLMPTYSAKLKAIYKQLGGE